MADWGWLGDKLRGIVRTFRNLDMNVILNVTAFGMTGREAVDAKRLHHQWLPDRASLEAGALSEELWAER